MMRAPPSRALNLSHTTSASLPGGETRSRKKSCRAGSQLPRFLNHIRQSMIFIRSELQRRLHRLRSGYFVRSWRHHAQGSRAKKPMKPSQKEETKEGEPGHRAAGAQRKHRNGDRAQAPKLWLPALLDMVVRACQRARLLLDAGCSSTWQYCLHEQAQICNTTCVEICTRNV